MDREIRLVLKALEDHKNLADFIKKVEQIKYFIVSFARDLTSGRTLYTLCRYKSYPSYPVYTKHSHNLQSFQRYNDKVYNVRFLSCVYKKDINSKNKSIDRTSQNKSWEAGRDINKDICIYIIYSDDEDFYIS